MLSRNAPVTCSPDKLCTLSRYLLSACSLAIGGGRCLTTGWASRYVALPLHTTQTTLRQDVGIQVQVVPECTDMARPHGCKLVCNKRCLPTLPKCLAPPNATPLVNYRRMNAGIRPGGRNPGLNRVPLQQPQGVTPPVPHSGPDAL